jgi:DNA mismatch endonuclease (patch repair protein)
MGRIQGKNTKPEIVVRRYLHRQGFRFRIHDRKLPGSPDIVLPKYRTIVFVHGCFWHGHSECGMYRPPKTNTEFWEQKITSNRIRDEKNRLLLEQRGWRVLVVWECELKTRNLRETTLAGLVNEIWGM